MNAKTFANQFGWPESEAQRLYREARQLARTTCAAANELRQRVWEKYSPSPASHKMWRSGMEWKFAKAFDGGDENDIPDFDLVAMELKQDVGDLFAYLQSGFERLPTPEETWSELFAMLEQQTGRLA